MLDYNLSFVFDFYIWLAIPYSELTSWLCDTFLSYFRIFQSIMCLMFSVLVFIPYVSKVN